MENIGVPFRLTSLAAAISFFRLVVESITGALSIVLRVSKLGLQVGQIKRDYRSG